MKTIIKNQDGSYWVRECGQYIGTFKTLEEAEAGREIIKVSAKPTEQRTSSKITIGMLL